FRPGGRPSDRAAECLGRAGKRWIRRAFPSARTGSALCAPSPRRSIPVRTLRGREARPPLLRRVMRKPGLGATLRKYWQQCVKQKTTTFASLRPPAPEVELDRFEAKYGVRLPADMRSYLASVDGMERNDSEGDWLFSFWQLDRIRPIPEYDSEPSFPRVDSYFCFADYLIESEVFSIFLSADPKVATPVVGSNGIHQARSFTEFVEKYMENPEDLLR